MIPITHSRKRASLKCFSSNRNRALFVSETKETDADQVHSEHTATRCSLLLLPIFGLILSACDSATVGSPSALGRSSNNAGVVSTPTPHAQTLEEGEAVENQLAREAEANANTQKDPANQVQAEQNKIDQQIQNEMNKAEGNN
jgi:hypothetical protein